MARVKRGRHTEPLSGWQKGQRPRLSSKCRELCRPLFPPAVGCASTPVNLPHARSWLHPHRSGVRQSEWSTINNNPRLRDHQTLLHTAVAAAVAFASRVVSVLFFHPVNCCSLFLALPHASPVDNSLRYLSQTFCCRCPALCCAAKTLLLRPSNSRPRQTLNQRACAITISPSLISPAIHQRPNPSAVTSWNSRALCDCVLSLHLATPPKAILSQSRKTGRHSGLED